MRPEMVCEHGECGGDCYRCRCHRLVEDNETLRRAVEALIFGDLTVCVANEQGEWIYKTYWGEGFLYPDAIAAAIAGVRELDAHRADD